MIYCTSWLSGLERFFVLEWLDDQDISRINLAVIYNGAHVKRCHNQTIMCLNNLAVERTGLAGFYSLQSVVYVSVCVTFLQ